MTGAVSAGGLPATERAAGRPVGSQIIMELRNIRKVFGETKALQGLDLTLRSHEILGIAGPNGAGKSTLIKILAGEEARDEGTILVDGDEWMPGDPADRVAVVHQEPQVWANLTVGQNLLVGREGTQWSFPRVSPREREVLRELDVERYIDFPLQECPLAVRQRAEIARAVAQDARFFLFDEPNSALTEDESNQLFAYMHDLARSGKIVILVTHRLAEMVAHCSRAVVVRDGRVTAEVSGTDLTEAALARELVVGHEILETGDEDRRGEVKPSFKNLALRVSAWTHRHGMFRNVSLEVRRSEVVAIVGVEGSGARELAASLAGYEPTEGTITIGQGGAEQIENESVYLSADRRGMLFPNLSVGENLVIRLGAPHISRMAGVLSLARLREVALQLVQTFRVRTASVSQPLPSLSGGNQQKVAIAAAIAKRPTLLVLEEPTRGVDVGSKADIYRILREFARAGNGVLVYCTEVPEVYELADRCIVIDEGQPVLSLNVGDFDELTSLASAIATSEHTAIDQDDLVASHALTRDADAPRKESPG